MSVYALKKNTKLVYILIRFRLYNEVGHQVQKHSSLKMEKNILKNWNKGKYKFEYIFRIVTDSIMENII